METVAAELGRRHASAAPADDGEDEIGRGHLPGAGADRVEAAPGRRVAQHRLEAEIVGHVAGRGLVGLELFGDR